METTQISDTAIVKNCNIGEGTKVWNFANIYGCSIGKNCTIGTYVEIQNNVKIGNGVIISSHSFICSLVIVEDGVFIGHGVMTVNDLFPPSRKRNNSTGGWKPTYIGEGAIIGSNATLLPVRIGNYSIVAAGSVVTKDVPPYSVVAGNPARVVKKVDEDYICQAKLMVSKLREE